MDVITNQLKAKTMTTQNASKTASTPASKTAYNAARNQFVSETAAQLHVRLTGTAYTGKCGHVSVD